MMGIDLIQVPNYGCGNLASILRMVDRVGGQVAIADQPSDLDQATKIILAGVGAFDHGMSSLYEAGWAEALHEAVLHRHIPILGICLGMQLMCKSSEEGRLPGLGWIDGNVQRIKLPVGSNLKIPHMGWNTINVIRPNPLILEEQGEQRFYFVHSYHVQCNNQEDIVATADHGNELTVAFSHDNIHGVQFHPEKSHRFGMNLMKKFVEL